MKMSHTFVWIDCPVCNGRDFEVVLTLTPREFLNEHRRGYYNLAAVGVGEDTPFFFRECCRCGFVFVNPRLRPDLYAATYNEAKIGQYEGKDWAYDGGDLSHLYNTFHKWSAALTFLPAVSYFRDRFSRAKNEGHRGLRLLDYGCGYGHVLQLADLFGVKAVGVEIDESRLGYCRARGLTVTHPEDLSAEEKFDIVVSSSVVEHVDDVNGFFRYVAQRLRPGGVFHFSGLNPNIIAVERKRGAYKNVMPIEHLNYFTRRSLAAMLEKHGLRLIGQRHYLPFIRRPRQLLFPLLDQFIYKGFYAGGNFTAEARRA